MARVEVVERGLDGVSQVGNEGRDVHAHEDVRQAFEQVHARDEHLSHADGSRAAEQLQRDGSLNNRSVELFASAVARLAPDFLPCVVCLEELTFVEESNAFEVGAVFYVEIEMRRAGGIHAIAR